jgi:hypothetical protein
MANALRLYCYDGHNGTILMTSAPGNRLARILRQFFRQQKGYFNR